MESKGKKLIDDELKKIKERFAISCSEIFDSPSSPALARRVTGGLKYSSKMPGFITPEEAFANYEDDSNGESVSVTRDDDDNNTTGVLQWFGGCVVRIKQIFGRNPKNRFVYPNGWTTNKSKMSQCKEDDLNWSLTNEQQFNDHSLSKDPCVNISIFLLLMAVISVLAGNMLPRW